MNKKIAVLVSGGVDSSVALRLLHEQGYEITAFYLKIWLEDELSFLGTCPWEEDLAYVQAVCEQINVPLEIVSLQQAYWDRVVAYTIAEVKAGRTPNPDMLCNQQVKFGAFYDIIGDRFDTVATGHYAQIEQRDGYYQLKMTPDSIKDQTYFLAQLSQEQLSKAMFPIGQLTKAEVRALAQKFDLPNKDRKDSQGICFLGKLKFAEFLKAHCGTRPGNLVELETNTVLGRHEGFWFYTIGQRQGIGLAAGPWYVAAKDPVHNIVYISRAYHEPDKVRNHFNISSGNWFNGKSPATGTVQVKLRHGAHVHNAQLTVVDDNGMLVTLDNRDQGIAPGQFAVFYDGPYCLGSAVIEQGAL